MNWKRFGRAVTVAPWLFAAGAGCAGKPAVAPPQTSVRLAPPPESAEPLPVLPPLQHTGSIAEARGPVLKNLSADGQDLSEVIKVVATQFGLQYQIDPMVRGRVTTTLRNKTLPEALDAILPQGIGYEVRGGVLRVGPERLETRIFTLDYVALARIGTASTAIQRRLGAGQGGAAGGATGAGGGAGAAGAAGAGAGGGLGGGADVILAMSIADVWEDVRVAVEAFTFSSTSGSPGLAAGASPFSASSGAIGGRPFTRTDSTGRRLIVNAIAGTITVTALPGQLSQIENFIRTFEASIQRQVLIEAKIVEVNLERSSEFGIDWNVVAGNTTTGLTSRGATGSNIQFTLTGGGAQINAVLTALASQGDVRVLSSPRVSALNNQRAVFNVTTSEIVFQQTVSPTGVAPGGGVTTTTTVTPTQVNVGIVLDVLAQIGANNSVTMNIRPVVTSVLRIATFTGADGSGASAPVIDTRESDTMARLRAGETIIIGGLMQTRYEKVRSGVPVLRSIPLLGRAFSRTLEVERKAELVIFLTPTIIAGQPPASR